ncbi:MAG: phytoene desaturase [Ignavibacteriae bacterium HGW-Ignavibacteriae-1]|jgi:phytoene desaturase|nr:MAG: phytoene desaturase [Ignavibacteriae bacterium HGW-Ignavibacteriae-1]
MKKKKVIIVGAGPGGLVAGMILSQKGFDVHIYEKKAIVGGRNGFIQAGEFKFDLGPTFFLMKDVLERIFKICNRNLDDYVKITQLDPMYKLVFNDKTFAPTTDKERMVLEIERVFPGSSKGYLQYIEREQKKYDRLIPCLEVPYGSLTDYFSLRLLKALPYLDGHLSLFDVLGKYFDDDFLKVCFTFQAKYIGMSPWQAPGLFSILSFIEHGGGVFHVNGGLNELSKAIAKVIEECDGNIHLSKGVKKLIVENSVCKGVLLEDGSEERADYVVLNADFAHAMKNLVEPADRRKYTDKKLKKMKYSCSTFMLYLGLDKKYEKLYHHNIFFANDYKHNVDEIVSNSIIPDDPSIYVHNPSLIDDSLAPDGKSSVYVLVPIGNTSGGIDWTAKKEAFKEKILNILETKAGINDIRSHIEELRIITPDDWENQMDIYDGATFNLGHNMGQLLYFRPHNEFEEFANCYLVGGGTHPGSGLPTIYESARISSELILKKEGLNLYS